MKETSSARRDDALVGSGPTAVALSGRRVARPTSTLGRPRVRRLLTLVGAIAVLGTAVASVAALLLLRDRLHVTIAGETDARAAGPDPVQLLRDDVATLRGDLAALTQTLARNFETMASTGDEQEAARRELLATLAALRDRVDALPAAVAHAETAAATRADASDARHDAALRTLADRLDAMAHAAELARTRESAPRPPEVAATTPSPAAPAPPTVSPPAPVTPPPPPSAPAVAATSAGGPPVAPPPTPDPTTASAGRAPPATAPATAPAAAPRRKGFLSFSLPSQSVDFDRALRFEVVPSLSRLGFDAKSTLHDFSGVTSELSGGFVARLTQPGRGTTGELRARAATLDTGLAARNTELVATLDAERYPEIVVRIVGFEPTSTDPTTKASAGTARLGLTVHGVSRDLAMPVRVSLDESRRVVVEGEATVRMTDFGVVPPRKMGFVSVDDAVRVWVSLRARAVGAAE